jgi:uncharacterized protein
MSRYIRNLAMAASAACVCGLLTAGAAAAAPASGLTIHQVLGGGHVSLYAGQTVSDVPGVVTDVTSSAFYLQDPQPAGGPFKQAIEVYTGSKPTVAAGDDVTVTVQCDVNMSPFTVLGFNPAMVFSGRAVAPLDTFVERNA